jgi:ATPase subunit of ABC transporter with duplicated ATPase domains
VSASRLLRLLAGQERPDSGTVVARPPNASVVLLPQERDRQPDETLRAYLHRRTGVAAAEMALAAAADRLAHGHLGADDAYAAALDGFLAVGGADLDGRAPGVLADLGLRADLLDQATTSLSGGELAWSALAAVLLARADVLLLDEPTNDLDLAGLARLEAFLEEREGGLVVGSHDRTFLERVATEVLEIDEHRRTARLVGGGFGAYVRERERALETAREARRTYEGARDDLVGRARREKSWARQGAARAAGARARNDEPDRNVRAARTAGAEGRGAAAARILRALDRLEEVPSVRERRPRRCGSRPGRAGARTWPASSARSSSKGRSGWDRWTCGCAAATGWP